MDTLTVLYDERCEVCRRARDWLASQPTHVRLDLLASGSPAARRRFGSVPWVGQELIAVADDGRMWVGPAAFLTCLWATRRYRSWSYRLGGETLAPVAGRFFRMVSKRRRRCGRYLDDPEAGCSWCQT